MSSGFVSGGTNDAPLERDAEWLAAQAALDAARRAKQLAERSNAAEGHRSLYDVLQQNKAAKQEAFEESLKLKHQFQALDEDGADFLDAVARSERARDEAVRRETRERLEAFRKRREAADAVPAGTVTGTGADAADSGATKIAAEGGVGDASLVQEPQQQQQQWSAAGKKRRRAQDKELLRGVKLRKAASAEQQPAGSTGLEEGKNGAESALGEGDGRAKPGAAETKSSVKTASGEPPSPPPPLPSSDQAKKQASPPAKPAGLGLGAYDSDSD